MQLAPCSSFRRQQVTKPEGVTTNDFAEGTFYRISKHWPVKNKCMKLAVLTAGINMRRELRKKFFINYSADERWIELRRVYADDR